VLSVPFFKTAMVRLASGDAGLGLLGAIVAWIVMPQRRDWAVGAGSAGRVARKLRRLRRRQVIFATVAGVFALLALISGTLFR